MFQSIIGMISRCWKQQMRKINQDWNESMDLQFKDWLYCHGLNIGFNRDYKLK